MRNGTVIINGTNVYDTYHAFVSHGGYDSLVQWPSLKQISGNDWQEYDGFEPDLSNPCLDAKTVTISFVLMGNLKEIASFYRFLGSSPKQIFNFYDLGCTMTLRLVSMPSLAYAQEFHLLTCQFSADIPLEGYTYAAPLSDLPEKKSVMIDGTPLSAYGVRVLKGTVNGISREPDVKPLLIRNISTVPGATYDENPVINDPDDELGDDYESVGESYEGMSGNWKRLKATGSVTYSARNITVKCQMHSSKETFWRNYNALLYDLSKANYEAADETERGARNIILGALGMQFNCWYDSQSITDFMLDGSEIWAKFDISLNVYEDLGEYLLLLAAEDDRYIITEDGRNIAIELGF